MRLSRRAFNFLFGTTLILFLAFFINGLLFQKIQIESEFECNSGYVGMFLDMENIEYPENNTLRIKNFDINTFNNIQCKGKFKTNMPLFVYIKLLDT